MGRTFQDGTTSAAREKARGLEALAAAEAGPAGALFQGEDRVYAELEEVFLALEGAASWVAFLLVEEQRLEDASPAELVAEHDPAETAWIQV